MAFQSFHTKLNYRKLSKANNQLKLRRLLANNFIF